MDEVQSYLLGEVGIRVSFPIQPIAENYINPNLIQDHMTDKEIFQKAIEKAVYSGYNTRESLGIHAWLGDDVLSSGFMDEIDWDYAMENVNKVVFSHDFAKAFWGEELLCYDCGEKVKPPMEIMGANVQIGTGQCDCSRQFENNEPASEYHLQQMVVRENRIKYLEPFL